MDVVGYANENIGTNWRFGQLWLSNTVAVTPSVSGSKFWSYDFRMPMGTQQLVAAIRDMAGNMAYVTNTVCLTTVTNGSYTYDSAGCLTNLAYSGAGYSATFALSWNARYEMTSASRDGGVVESYVLRI